MSKKSKSSKSEKPNNLMNMPTDVSTGVIREFIGDLGIISTSRVSKAYKNHFLQEKHIKKAIKDFFVKELTSGIKNRITLEITDKMVSCFNSPDVQEYLKDIIEEIKTVELKPDTGITLQNITHINVINIKEDLKWLPNFPMMTDIVVKNCKKLTELSCPEATDVEVENCENLTEFSCPKATTAWVENCENLTELNCPEAKTVGVKNCKNLTELSCPETIDVWVENCENLTELNCPETIDVWVENCENLTKVSCPKATYVMVENCNNLRRETKEEEKSTLMTEEQESDTDSVEQPNTAMSAVITEAAEPDQDSKSCCIIS